MSKGSSGKKEIRSRKQVFPSTTHFSSSRLACFKSLRREESQVFLCYFIPKMTKLCIIDLLITVGRSLPLSLV